MIIALAIIVHIGLSCKSIIETHWAIMRDVDNLEVEHRSDPKMVTLRILGRLFADCGTV